MKKLLIISILSAGSLLAAPPEVPQPPQPPEPPRPIPSPRQSQSLSAPVFTPATKIVSVRWDFRK